MTICSLSLLELFVSGIVMYLFREPSEEEIKKLNSEVSKLSNLEKNIIYQPTTQLYLIRNQL